VQLVVGTLRSSGFGDVQTAWVVVIDGSIDLGVIQRATLRARGLSPDVLVMTATPIPTRSRSLFTATSVRRSSDVPRGVCRSRRLRA
jgi:ATP-dependent DNA helicase RecG